MTNVSTVSLEYVLECLDGYSHSADISSMEIQPFVDTIGMVASSVDAADLLTYVLYDIYERDPDILGELACVFDIDDTLIFSEDDSPNMPIVGLLYLCVQLGVHVYIVTARHESAREYTLDQLEILLGVSFSSSNLYMAMRTYSQSSEKDMARRDIHARYPILFSIGDQPHDIGDACGFGIIITP